MAFRRAAVEAFCFYLVSFSIQLFYLLTRVISSFFIIQINPHKISPSSFFSFSISIFISALALAYRLAYQLVFAPFAESFSIELQGWGSCQSARFHINLIYTSILNLHNFTLFPIFLLESHPNLSDGRNLKFNQIYLLILMRVSTKFFVGFDPHAISTLHILHPLPSLRDQLQISFFYRQELDSVFWLLEYFVLLRLLLEECRKSQRKQSNLTFQGQYFPE